MKATGKEIWLSVYGAAFVDEFVAQCRNKTSVSELGEEDADVAHEFARTAAEVAVQAAKRAHSNKDGLEPCTQS